MKTQLPKEDIMMLLKYMAYCLTLDYGLKTFMILCGQSNTGKSVLIRFFETMVGRQNVSSLSMHELNMRFYPSQLYNRLLNSCADNSSLPLSSIENLKKITGGDQIMHEKKGKEPFFFVPFCKLIFSFNQLPLQLEEKSNAFYKRMRILFMNTELFLNNEYVNDLCSEEGVSEVGDTLSCVEKSSSPVARYSVGRQKSTRGMVVCICYIGGSQCVSQNAVRVDKSLPVGCSWYSVRCVLCVM
jgi:hypothetical protein